MAQERLAVGLSGFAVLSCVVAGVLLSRAPLMAGGRHPTFGEVTGMIAVPTAAAALATWAAWRNRPALVMLGTALTALYNLVTGFSIGGGFLPALGLLVWATFATFSEAPD